MITLRRYWFSFKNDPQFSALGLGCGVTAFCYEDAVGILALRVFVEMPVPEIESVREDVDIRTLDQNHVIPNMGVVVIRGVWFPLGF